MMFRSTVLHVAEFFFFSLALVCQVKGQVCYNSSESEKCSTNSSYQYICKQSALGVENTTNLNWTITNSAGWCSQNTSDQYIHIILDDVYMICGVSTRSSVQSYVTKYWLQLLTVDNEWLFYRSRRGKNNTTIAGMRTVFLREGTMAKEVRFWPKTWKGYPCMRIELYGSKGGPGDTIVPDEIHAVGKGHHVLRVRWRLIFPIYLAYGYVQGYHVHLTNSDEPEYVHRSKLTGCDDKVVFTGLEENRKYCVYVTAFTQHGKGKTSPCINAVTGEKARVNFTAFSESSTSLRVNWSFEVSSFLLEDEERGFIINYNKKTELRSIALCNNTSSYLLTNLSIFTNYCISVYSFNKDEIDTNKQNTICVFTDEEAPSGAPINVTAKNTSSTGINVSWESIPVNLQHGHILGHRIIYSTLEHHGARKRRSAHLPDKSLMTVYGKHNLSVTIEQLETFTWYTIRVLGFNRIGNGTTSDPVSVRTDEGVPSKPPQMIKGYNTSATSIHVEWGNISVEFIHGHLLGYKVFITANHKAYNKAIDLGPHESLIDIHDLNRYTEYCIRVAGMTRKGVGNTSDCVNITTDDSVPSLPPPDVSVISRTSTNSLNVTWNSLSRDQIHGELLGYKVAYEEETGESGRQTRYANACPNATSISLYGLNIRTKYRVRVAAYTRKGLGPFSEASIGETCKCAEFLTVESSSSLLDVQGAGEEGSLSVLMASSLTGACGFCRSYGYVKLIHSKTPQDSSDVDIRFPVTMTHDLAEQDGISYFVPVIQVPGLVVIQRKREQEPGAYDKVMVSSLFNSWPIFAISGLLTLLAALIIWVLEVSNNPEEFKPKFIKGAGESVWWAFITMTTLGYGDRTPRSNFGKAFSMVWFLVGLVVFSIFSGAVTCGLTVIVVKGGPNSPSNEKLLNVSTLKDSTEKSIVLRKLINRFIIQEEHASLEKLVESLKKGETDAIILDMYVPVRRKDLFNGSWFEVTDVMASDITLKHGIQLRGDAVGLRKDIEDFIQANNVQTEFLIDKAHDENGTSDESNQKHQNEESPKESAVVFFEPGSPYFTLILDVGGGALGGFIVLGFFFELCRRIKRKAPNIQVQRYHENKAELKQILEEFYQNFRRTHVVMRKKNEYVIKQLKKSRIDKLHSLANAADAKLW